MSETFYSASLSRTQGRNTWALIFRHPKRTDPTTGKEGLRVRQSLKTDNEPEAAKLRDQMNTLLASPQLWDVGAREQALLLFDARIVDIFFYKLEGDETDFMALRDAAIALPPPSSSQAGAYRRVLLLGAAGAGKTTLLRQLIGTDPATERFPSTSTARATVHATEVLLEDGLYRAVVTFHPLDEVREHLKECVCAAVLAAHRNESDAHQMRRLLTHVDQRFRFNHVLGNGPASVASDADADSFMKRTNDVLAHALATVQAIAQRCGLSLRTEPGPADEKDQRVIDELFEAAFDQRTRDDAAFQNVVDAVMAEIDARFARLPDGKLQKSKVGWPLTWTWETDDRAAFVAALARFASNHALRFGSLLAPLVNGIRVAGPFYPAWTTERPKLVLLDGEGLTHTLGSMSTLSSALLECLDTVDAVVVVDNAMQPLLGACVAALHELVAAGHAAKLIFAFTQFERVVGDDLQGLAERSQHVLASADSVFCAIGAQLGAFAERGLRAQLTNARVFLANLDQALDLASPSGKSTATQLDKLLNLIATSVPPALPMDARPTYDRMDLVLSVERAAQRLRNGWRRRLGLSVEHGMEKVHWMRIRALSRRFVRGFDESDTLRPVADLKQQLAQQLYVLLQSPVSWDGPEPTDAAKQALFDAIAQDLGRRLLELAARRVKTERLSDWRQACDEAGPGSTFRRAGLIAARVCDVAAPVPDVTPAPDRKAFLHEVAAAVRESMQRVGAVLQ